MIPHDEILWQICPQILCPNNCEHCMARYTSQEDIPISSKLTILGRLLKAPFKRLALTGGEPLLYKDLPILLDYIQWNRKHGVVTPNIIICTTGTKVSSLLLQELKRSRVIVRLSIHKCFDDRNIESSSQIDTYLFLKACLEENLRVIVNTVIFREFRSEVDKFLNLWNNMHGIEQWNIVSPYITHSFLQDSPLYPSANDLSDAKALHGRIINNMIIDVSDTIRSNLLHVCRSVKYKVFINTLGCIARCLITPSEAVDCSLADISFQRALSIALKYNMSCKYILERTDSNKRVIYLCGRYWLT